MASAGKCPFGYGDDDSESLSQKRELQFTVQYPAELLTCSKANKTLTTNTTTFTGDMYSAIHMDVYAQYDSALEKAAYAACIVRLAGHDFIDYRTDAAGVETGGSDGCVDFNDPDNAGLQACLTATNIQSVYDKHCDTVSLADFVVIASEAAMSRTATKFDSNNTFANGTLESKFRNRFKAGRTTSETCNTTGLLPDAEAGCTDLESIFINHIYHDNKRRTKHKWRMTAAISGAHTLGSAKAENSGFVGSWSDEANQGIFNNDYYKSLILKGWAPHTIDATHHQWKRVDSHTADATASQQMMLSSDMCLAYQHNSAHDACVDEQVANGTTLGKAQGKCRGLQKQGEFLNAANVHCCAWTNTRALFNTGVLRRDATNDYCGVQITEPGNFTDARNQCCVGENDDAVSAGDCDSSKWPKGPAFNSILDFAEHEHVWLRDFTRAWWAATENGHENLVRVSMMDKRKKNKKRRQRQRQQKRSKKSNSRSSSSKSSRTTRNTRSARGGRGRGRGRNLLLI